MASELQTVSDEKLTRQSQAGSLAAFEELVHRYERRIYGFVAKCCGSASDASEITQDTFVRAFQAIARFDSRQAFAPWLFTIAANKAAVLAFTPARRRGLARELLIAECDFVAEVWKEQKPDPDQPNRMWEAFAFDVFRIQDGRLTEHWDERALSP